MVATAYTGPGIDIQGVANADLSTHQFKFVKQVVTTGLIALCTSSGEVALGILQNKPKANEAAQIRVFGPSKVIAGAAVPILAGSTPVQTDANGKAIAAVSTGKPTGIALIPAAALNDVITVHLAPIPIALP